MANIKHTYSHFVVLNDGETYTDMTGCRIVSVWDQDVRGYLVTDDNLDQVVKLAFHSDANSTSISKLYNLCCGYLGEQPHADVIGLSRTIREEGDAEKQ